MTTKKQKLSDVAKTLQMTPNDLIALFSELQNGTEKKSSSTLTEAEVNLVLESITAVNNGLMDFKGVVLFSSHDHEFVQTIANRIMVLEDGKLTDRLGTYEDYIASMANTAE